MGYYRPVCTCSFGFTYTLNGVNKRAVINMLPLSIRVTKKTYRESYGVEVTVPHIYFPFDPRIVQSGILKIHAGQLVDGQFLPSLDNILFLGYVDQHGIQGAAGRVTFMGSDYTGIFLATRATFPYPNPGQDIVSVFEQVISYIPAASNIKVRYAPTGAPPIVAPVLGKIDKTTTLGNFVQKDTNAWEFLQNIALAMGLICYMDFDTIVIADALSYRMDMFNDAYEFSMCQISETSRGNALDIRIDKKHGKYNSLQVILKSLHGREVVSGVYPETVNLSNVVVAIPAGSDGQTFEVKPKQVEAVEQVVEANTPLATLQKMAKRVYNELKSYQSECTITTTDLYVSTPNSASQGIKLDIFKIKIGENVLINNFWDSYYDANQLAQVGYDQQVAQDLYQLSQNSQRLYYISELNYDFQNESGFLLTIKGISRLNLSGGPESNNY